VGSQPDHSLGFGVFFNPQDYISFRWRLAIICIDGLVLAVAVLLVSMVLMAIQDEAESTIVLAALLLVWGYEALLKPSSLRTVGYRLINCRIVTLQGKRPSIFRMTFRALLWMLGPMNLIYDLGWCGVDEEKQTLRDRFASTLVVRQGAEPIGTGPIHLARFSAMSYVFFFPQVTRPQPSSAPSVAIANTNSQTELT